jgi:hypothetical protein
MVYDHGGYDMDEKTWNEEIKSTCDKIVDVQGGCNCHHPDGNGYCYFKNCPKTDNGGDQKILEMRRLGWVPKKSYDDLVSSLKGNLIIKPSHPTIFISSTGESMNIPVGAMVSVQMNPSKSGRPWMIKVEEL